MNPIVDSLMVLVVLTNFILLGSGRVCVLIQISGFQGVLLAVITLLGGGPSPDLHTWILAGTILTVLGLLIPFMLNWAVRRARIETEVQPNVGYALSLVLGVGIVAVSFLLSFRGVSQFAYVLPYALSGVLFGLLLIITRRRAITQVIGYLVLGNGIYLFGIGLAAQQPLLVELGVLLNTFIAVMVMGIGMHHINQAFDHIDVSKLNMLRDEP